MGSTAAGSGERPRNDSDSDAFCNEAFEKQSSSEDDAAAATAIPDAPPAPTMQARSSVVVDLTTVRARLVAAVSPTSVQTQRPLSQMGIRQARGGPRDKDIE